MTVGNLTPIQLLAVFAVPVVFAITLHEVAHGWIALRLGDRTAQMLGRLTLNPIKHVDPIGTIMVPALLLLFHLPPFGWAKPVPIGARNLRHPRRDMALVAAAGPVSNLLMALGWALVARGASISGADEGGAVLPLLYAMGLAGLFVNVVLAVLNLVPLPPLDGGRVLNGFLPPGLSDKFERVEPFGFPILLLLLWTGVLWPLLSPLIGGILSGMASLSGVSIADLRGLLR